MQPFLVLHTQMGVPFELPQWVFRAQQDVLAQTNFFDNIVQASKRPTPAPRTFRILKRGERPWTLGPGEQMKVVAVPVEEGEIKDCASTEANCSSTNETTNPVTEVTCGCPETNCIAGMCPNQECPNNGPCCPTRGCSKDNGHNSECDGIDECGRDRITEC
jgi:hypothetical protein